MLSSSRPTAIPAIFSPRKSRPDSFPRVAHSVCSEHRVCSPDAEGTLDDSIHLDRNENPYGPSDLAAAIREGLGATNFYPDVAGTLQWPTITASLLIRWCATMHAGCDVLFLKTSVCHPIRHLTAVFGFAIRVCDPLAICPTVLQHNRVRQWWMRHCLHVSSGASASAEFLRNGSVRPGRRRG
jgi:hypothetical protein